MSLVFGIGILYRTMVKVPLSQICTIYSKTCKESGTDSCATGAAAAQVVPHVHFHIIPRPSLTPELRNKSFTMFGRGQRSERDDDEAAALARSLREELAGEMERIQNREKL
jgi:diadenosine tetraphosphate (Ap4A) HIT family hydrolase